MSAWQPMETAPKDGHRVLLVVGDSHICIGCWSEEAEFGHGRGSRPGWQIVNCDEDQWYSSATGTAMWWMPLPAPPSGKSK